MAQTTFNGPVASQNGFQFTALTNAAILAIENPPTGLMVFNSTLAEMAYYNGETWIGAELPAAPTVLGVVPPTGPEAGGTSITISGTSFIDVSAVTIGGTPVASFTVVDSSTITAVTAAHAAGSGLSVNVTNLGGTNTPNTLFTYAAPIVTYSAGVDYYDSPSNGLYMQVMSPPSGTFSIQAAGWSNTAALATLLTQPAGTVYTIMTFDGTYEVTSTQDWSASGSISCNFNGYTGPMGSANILSISFAPAPGAVTYSYGTDYTVNGNLSYTPMGQLQTTGFWVNAAAQASVESQPSGTVYTIVAEGGAGTGAFVTSGTWNTGGFNPTVSGTGTPPFVGGTSINIISISFIPAPPAVTYTRGVDWIDGSSSVLYSGMTGTIQSVGAPWANSAAEAIFTSQPSGTVYTVVATDTTTGTIVTTGAWSGGGGFMSATANASGTFAPGFNYTLISVTFTPS